MHITVAYSNSCTTSAYTTTSARQLTRDTNLTCSWRPTVNDRSSSSRDVVRPRADHRDSRQTSHIVGTASTFRVRPRRWAAFNNDNFIAELSQSQLLISPPDNVDELFQCYDTMTHHFHPRQISTLCWRQKVCRRTSSCYNRDCHTTKLKTRILEKTFRRRPNPAAKSMWRAQFSQQRKLFQQTFIDHWYHEISSCNWNSKTMWSHLKCLLTRPEETLTEHSPDEFARHFQEKIERIRLSTVEFWHSTITNRNVDTSLDVFEPVSVEEVVTIIRKSPSKQCFLDPMPTWLLKNVCEYMAPIIASMCNASISQNRFPVN